MLSKSDEKQQLIVFGENLRRLRKERGLSMEALANLAEIELSQISRIETAKINCKLITLLRIAKALEVSPKELL